jgi:hypothetical protein
MNGRVIDMLRVYDYEDLDALPAGKWGIREPEPVRGEVPRQDGGHRKGNTASGPLIVLLFFISYAERRFGLDYHARCARVRFSAARCMLTCEPERCRL